MPQIRTRSARKSYTCEKGCTISPGEMYYSAKPYRAPKRIRCKDHPFAPGEAQGGTRGDIIAVEDGLGNITFELREDIGLIADDLNGYAEQVRGISEEYEEKASNIEDGFGHATYMSDEFQDNASQLEEWASDIDNAADEIREMAGETLCTCEHREEYHVLTKVRGHEEYVCSECDDDPHEYVEDESWVDDALSILQGVSSCPI